MPAGQPVGRGRVSGEYRSRRRRRRSVQTEGSCAVILPCSPDGERRRGASVFRTQVA